MNPPPIPKIATVTPPAVPPPPVPVPNAYATMLEQGRASIMSGSVRYDNNCERAPLCNGTIVGQYLIVSLMGMGGFGLTYLAINQKDNRQVVLKEHMPVGIAIREADGFFVTTPTQEAEDSFQSTLDEFRDEINILMALEHPGIVRIVDAFEANGTAYYVMPLIRGVPLDASKRAEMDRSLRSREARRIRQQLVSMLNALSYLDQNNVVHRDLKPENILITPEGHPILLDFGSARQILSGREYSNVFTPAFCAPEQAASSRDPKWGRMKMGPWTDLYSLGACFYYCITRMLPPSAENRIFSDPSDPYRPLATRQDLQEVYGDSFLKALDRALSLNVEDRWQHAKDWLSSLEKGGTRAEKAWRWRNLIPYGVAAVFAAVCACSLYWNLSLKQECRLLYESGVSLSSNLLADFYTYMIDLPGSSPIQEKFCKYLGDYMHSMDETEMSAESSYRANAAIAHLNIGKYHYDHGNLAPALENLAVAERNITSLIEAVPAELQYRYILAGIRIQRAATLHALGNDAEAEIIVATAVDMMRSLCQSVPQSPDYVGTLCGALILDATIKHDNGQVDAAAAILDELLGRLETNLSAFAKHQASLQRKAEALHLRGLIALNRSLADEAEQFFLDERDLYAQLLEKSRYRLSYLEGEARAMFFMGYVYSYRADIGQDDGELRNRALEIYQKHIEKCVELEQLDSERPAFFFAECRSLFAIQSIMLRNAQVNHAEAYATKLMRKAKLLSLQLAPGHVDYACILAAAHCAMASVHLQSDQNLHLAEAELAESRSQMAKLLPLAPVNQRLLSMQVQVMEKSAELAAKRGAASAEAAYLQEARAAIATLRQAYPQNTLYDVMLRRVNGKIERLAPQASAVSP